MHVAIIFVPLFPVTEVRTGSGSAVVLLHLSSRLKQPLVTAYTLYPTLHLISRVD